MSLVEIYLAKVHGQAHSIFHPPTLRGQLSSDSVPMVLVYAMSALGSKFSGNSQHREMGHELASKARRLVLADMENICLENIQACILVAMLSAGNCNISSEALFIRKEELTLLGQVLLHVSVATDRRINSRYGYQHGPHYEIRYSCK